MNLGNGDPGQRAMCRLLRSIVGSYIDTFDEEPLPVAVAEPRLPSVCSMWWPAWTSTEMPTDGWPISTVSPRWICVTNLPLVDRDDAPTVREPIDPRQRQRIDHEAQRLLGR